MSRNGVAFSGGISGALTMAMNEKTSVTFGGSVDYLSAVPVASHGTTVLASGGGSSGTATTTSGAAGAGAGISTGGMTTYGLTISLNSNF